MVFFLCQICEILLNKWDFAGCQVNIQKSWNEACVFCTRHILKTSCNWTVDSHSHQTSKFPFLLGKMFSVPFEFNLWHGDQSPVRHNVSSRKYVLDSQCCIYVFKWKTNLAMNHLDLSSSSEILFSLLFLDSAFSRHTSFIHP